MAGSLRDQLLKSGLADEKQARKAGQDKRRARKAGKGRGAPAGADALEASRRAKAEQDRALERERQAARQRKESEAQIRQLLERHRVKREEGDTPFSFQVDGKVRTWRVSDSERSRLVGGQLAIAGLGDDLQLIPPEIAARIAQRDTTAVKLNNASSSGNEPDDDDPYSEYVVPDDLTW